MIFAGYTSSKNQVWNRLKIQFVELNSSNLTFQKSSTDEQGQGTYFLPKEVFEALFSSASLILVGIGGGSKAWKLISSILLLLVLKRKQGQWQLISLKYEFY